MKLDKFYTKPAIAEQCVSFLKEKLPLIGNETYLEPSAGDGSFLAYLPQFTAIDIKPEGSNIQAADFFTYSTPADICIGNPPFGSRSAMAIKFFNHAAELCSIIAFILPVSFMKWGVQKQLAAEWKLYDYFYIPENAFTDNGKDYSVRCVFQIWTKADYGQNLRLKKAPPISHPDFKIWQYNATQQAYPCVEEDWEYAVYRQGYKDYNSLFTRKDYEHIKEEMNKNIQFFFIKPLTEQAEQFVRACDFSALAERNISTPGFGKADFVGYYEEYLNERNH